eukprot:3753777-Amphidinium_carterae.1
MTQGFDDIKPLIIVQDVMTWHDKSTGGFQETKYPPAHAYHSGTLLSVLSVHRCRKYFPQSEGRHGIYVGRAFSVVKDFHDDGNGPCQSSAHQHNFPIGSMKITQQLVVTKAVVCPHGKQGCVLAGLDHLGIYSFMIMVDSVQTRHVNSASSSTAWVETARQMDVIAVSGVKPFMIQYYQTREAVLPTIADPTLLHSILRETSNA